VANAPSLWRNRHIGGIGFLHALEPLQKIPTLDRIFPSQLAENYATQP
jgi:hypothetical protein